MSSRTRLNIAVKNALVLGSASALAFTFPTLAEEQAGAEEVERIQVTGSRINRTDMETASPVTVVSSEYIAQAGYKSVDEILANQPSAAGMSLGASSNNGSGGTATVNLRGMGSQRTLVLLNGRRMVASGTGADSSVDLNTIPVAMIQSIEILKDGASAVYGSDAIAGVVNIITKKDFEGTELTVDAGITDKGDGENYGFSLLHGTELAGGNLTVGFQYSGREDVIQSDRDFTPPGQSSFIPGGTLGGKVWDKETESYKDRDTGYDYTTSSYAQTPNDLYSIFTSYNKELAGDIELTGDLMYTRRESNQQMAPQPASIELDHTQLDDKYTDEFIDPDTGIIEGDTLEYRRRMVEAGPRIYEQETDTVRASVGLSGYTANDDSWDVSLTYAKNESKDWVQNSIHAGRMEESIYDHQDQWFAGEIDNDFLVAEGVIYTESNEGGNEQAIFNANYAGLLENDVGYALGYEGRYESGYYTPDMVTQMGESTAAQQDPTDGSYNVHSVYAEVSVPVSDAFNVEAATRYDEYSTFGGELTWKLGATYRFTDEFMIRSVAATGFRAPNVSELYGGNTGSYDYLSDPWGFAEDSQILVNYTSDPNLEAEESESFTFGAVWEIADGLSTTLDYWSFDIDNAIGRVNVQNELNSCFEGNIESCNTINIDPSDAEKGDLSALSSPLTNIGTQKSSGVDWNVNYTGDDYKIAFDATYLLEFEEDGVDYTGTIDGNYGGYAEFKANINYTTYITEDLSMLYHVQYIGAMEGEAWGEEFEADETFYFNMSSTYHMSDDISFNAGIKNVFDQEPQSVPNGSDMETVPEVYDTIGRRFFVSSTIRF